MSLSFLLLPFATFCTLRILHDEPSDSSVGVNAVSAIHVDKKRVWKLRVVNFVKLYLLMFCFQNKNES